METKGQGYKHFKFCWGMPYCSEKGFINLHAHHSAWKCPVAHILTDIDTINHLNFCQHDRTEKISYYGFNLLFRFTNEIEDHSLLYFSYILPVLWLLCVQTAMCCFCVLFYVGIWVTAVRPEATWFPLPLELFSFPLDFTFAFRLHQPHGYLQVTVF